MFDGNNVNTILIFAWSACFVISKNTPVLYCSLHLPTTICLLWHNKISRMNAFAQRRDGPIPFELLFAFQPVAGIFNTLTVKFQAYAEHHPSDSFWGVWQELTKQKKKRQIAPDTRLAIKEKPNLLSKYSPPPKERKHFVRLKKNPRASQFNNGALLFSSLFMQRAWFLIEARFS